MINKDTMIYASFGKIAGNNGCKFFNKKFKENGINAIYKSFSVNNISDAINAAKNLNFKGFAVSMPYKKQIIDLLDDVDKNAKEIGAVNTVINTNGKLVGYNTDYLAIKEILQEYNIKSLYIIGNGGFASAAKHTCHLLNIPYKIIDRSNFGNLDFIKNETILNCTPVENIKVDSSNQYIDGIPTTNSGKLIARKQAEHQYKLYIK
jgi:shikimate 5-dehydrogenase